MSFDFNKSGRHCFAVTHIFVLRLTVSLCTGEASAEISITSRLVNRFFNVLKRSGAINDPDLREVFTVKYRRRIMREISS